jgi:hypothetical protein
MFGENRDGWSPESFGWLCVSASNADFFVFQAANKPFYPVVPTKDWL